MKNLIVRGLGFALAASAACAQAGCEPAPELSRPLGQEPPTVPPPQSPPPESPPPQSPPVVTGELFDGKTVQAEHSVPVVGGTLLVTRDGKTIAAADPDRDALFLVDQATRVVSKVAFARGDEPGRVTEGPDGTVFVALRRAGALLAIDVATATVTKRAAVCASPRGVAYDPKTASVYVACRSGQLRTLDAATLSQERTLQLDTDLRDVIVRAHDLVVTRFLSAEVLVVAEDGSTSRRARPPSPCGEATVAYRALALPDGQVAVAHQISSNDAVGEGPGGYGDSGSCGVALVSRALTTVDTETPSGLDPQSGLGEGGAFSAGLDPEGDVVRSPMSFRSGFLPGAGPLDVAFDAQGTRLATIALDDQLTATVPSGQSLPVGGPLALDPQASLWLTSFDANAGAFNDGSPITSVKLTGQPIAVAFSAEGKYIVQSREPATLAFEDGSSITLSDESHADTGHLMFHMNSGIGIACASCHPEGGDDGHVWRFPEGLRRTMPLEGGVMERAPFHWDGTLGDMSELVNAVMVTRMGLAREPSAPQIAALGAFLEQLPNLPPPDDLDAAAVRRGEAVFRRADVACASCHSGPQFTNNRLEDVGTGGKFVTPTLLGIGLRPALFHDGCAKSIVERFGVCGGTAHGKPELLSADEQADLITFLRSL